jgi:hypothetical protein
MNGATKDGEALEKAGFALSLFGLVGIILGIHYCNWTLGLVLGGGLFLLGVVLNLIGEKRSRGTGGK